MCRKKEPEGQQTSKRAPALKEEAPVRVREKTVAEMARNNQERVS